MLTCCFRAGSAMKYAACGVEHQHYRYLGYGMSVVSRENLDSGLQWYSVDTSASERHRPAHEQPGDRTRRGGREGDLTEMSSGAWWRRCCQSTGPPAAVTRQPATWCELAWISTRSTPGPVMSHSIRATSILRSTSIRRPRPSLFARPSKLDRVGRGRKNPG